MRMVMKRNFEIVGSIFVFMRKMTKVGNLGRNWPRLEGDDDDENEGFRRIDDSALNSFWLWQVVAATPLPPRLLFRRKFDFLRLKTEFEVATCKNDRSDDLGAGFHGKKT
eukprot:jgi/Bigna1/133944/aug1.23_g8652